MKINELKNQILAKHNLLRALLVNVGDVAQMVAAGDTSSEELLRRGAHQLSTELLRHMADEERLLEELVREGYSPAAGHLAELKQNHFHQRTLLASFSALIDEVHATRQLAETIEAMTHAVVLDMDYEEGAIFGSESLVSAQQPPPRLASVA